MEKQGAPVARRRGRPRQFDETAAVDAAMRLFWEHGYEGTSIADLTAAMGITPQSLYTAFGSKQQLFQRALAHYSETGGTGAQDALALPDAVDAGHALLLWAAEQFTRRGLPHGCMVSTGSLRVGDDNRAIGVGQSGQRTAMRQAIERRLQRGRDEGQLGADTDVAALARYLATAIQGLAVQAADGASRPALVAVARLAGHVLDAARA